MDRYDARQDHYCWPGTTTLKNLLNIRDMEELEVAERDITAHTVMGVQYDSPPYSLATLQGLHKQIFSELYAWAGEIRTVDIAKGGTYFCTCTRVKAEAEKIFQRLSDEYWLAGLEHDDFCGRLAEYYCEINMIHPFREGNGRVQRLLFEFISLAAGYQLDWAEVTADQWLAANMEGVNVNYLPMKAIFLRITSFMDIDF